MVVRPVPVTWSCNACAMKWAGGDVWYLTSGVRQIGTHAMHLGRMRFAIQRFSPLLTRPVLRVQSAELYVEGAEAARGAGSRVQGEQPGVYRELIAAGKKECTLHTGGREWAPFH